MTTSGPGRAPTAPARSLSALARRHPIVAALWVVVLLAALVQGARAATFAADVTRAECSVQPSSRFRTQHNCYTAYAEAVRFARQGEANIYDAALYRPRGVPRMIGPLTVDPYHYPPPFLLLPGLVTVVAPSFFDSRLVWFGLQVLVLLGTMLATAWWIGGDAGRAAALAVAACWALPTTWAGLQSGNFQTTGLAMAMGGMLLASTHRTAAGATLLAYAASAKVFPSMLILHVIATRRWRVVGAIAAAGLAIAALTAAVFGLAPFRYFLVDELPQLSSGSAFPQIEDPSANAVNLSIYGFTVKLRALGLGWLDPSAGRLASRVYALALAALAITSGRLLSLDAPAPGRLRLERAAAWLGLLNLASFASPFVGGMYGSIGTSWLLVLLAGGASTTRARWGWLAVLAFNFWVPWTTPAPRTLPVQPMWAVAQSAVWQVVALAVNTWAVWQPAARERRAAEAVAGKAVVSDAR